METGNFELDRQHEETPIDMIWQDKWQKRYISCCSGSECRYWSKSRELKVIPSIWVHLTVTYQTNG
jgi:hypothetical protein